jgi:hypothetical protein
LELKTGATLLDATAAGMAAAESFSAADSLAILIGGELAICIGTGAE